MSVGLFKRLPLAAMHRCVQGAYQTGGDSMLTECLWKVLAWPLCLYHCVIILWQTPLTERRHCSSAARLLCAESN